MSRRSSEEASGSARSALSASLKQQQLQRQLQQQPSQPMSSSSSLPASLPHTSLDLSRISTDARSTRNSMRRPSSSGTEDALLDAQEAATSFREELPFGKSPMYGAPWPFVIKHQQQQSQQLSPVQGGESPRHHARPSWVSRDARPASRRSIDSAGGRPRVLSPVRPGEGEPLLGASGPDGWEERSDGSGAKSEAGAESPRRHGSRLSDILYGFINAIVGAPTMISFAAIIFSDKAFSPFLGQLSRLAFLSSSIHQAVFTIFSTLPFAVGQVQDVGLIFLSSMATSIAHEGLSKGFSRAEVLGTTLVTTTISTFAVGLLIVLVGHFRLASLVQYVPLSTVGGYLGYVGYFCLAAGLGLACSTTVDTFQSWVNLFHRDQLIKLGPALGSTAALYLTMHLSRSPLALPGVLICIPLVFHAVLLGRGWSLTQAAEAGWVMRGEKASNFWDLYALFNIHDWRLSSVDKMAAVKQAPKVLALFFVVAFGSSLDVAAIQAGLGAPLDFNHELKTVGLSNMVSGLLGAGFTGSYIFSQTIFSMRAFVRSKLHGLIIAGTEFALFAIPVGVIEYIPNFFFGSLLMLFGIEIIIDWLVFSYNKVQRIEFILLWATYLAIMFTNLEAGIGIGIILATLYFAFSYARVHVSAFTVVPSRSGVVRPFSERSVLEVFMAKMAALSLSGYIFFGSSVSISEKVMAVAQALTEHNEEQQDHLAREPPAPNAGDGQENPLWTVDSRQRTRQALAAAPCYVLLDFRSVHGLDATAAQSFGTLWTQLRQQGVELLLTHVRSASMHRLLQAHGVAASASESKGDGPTAAARVFDTMEDGVQHCEDSFLRIAVRYQLCQPRATVMSLEDTLRSHDQVPNMVLGKQVDYRAVADSLRGFLEVASFDSGDVIFSPGDDARHLYIIEEGTVCMHGSFLTLTEAERDVRFPPNLVVRQPDRRFQFGPGSIIGTTDFFLRRPRGFEATAVGRCRLWTISKHAFDRIAHEAPEALIVLLTIVARTSVLDSMHVWEYLERVNASK